MKNFLSLAASCSVVLFLLASCQRDENEQFNRVGNSHVTFRAALDEEAETKTALSFKFVPSWENTDEAQIHLFETCDGGSAREASEVHMSLDPSYPETAHFQAEFPSQAGSSYRYTGVIASRESDAFYLPSTQYPATQGDGSFDPAADFLVARSNDFGSSQTDTEVDLFFSRPVALSRLAIMGVEGTRIDKVIIEAEDYLTGSVKYGDIDFGSGTASFTTSGTHASKTLTLVYDAQTNPLEIGPEGTMYAYFSVLPGTHAIKRIIVRTDSYSYTKSFETAKNIDFSLTEFKQVSLDMRSAIRENYQPLEVWNGETLVVSTTFPNTLPVSFANEEPVGLTVEGVQGGAEVSVSSDDTTVATAAYENGILTVTPAGGKGSTLIHVTAGAVEGYVEATVSFVVEVTNTFVWNLGEPSYASASADKVEWVYRGYSMVLTKGESKSAANSILGGDPSEGDQVYTHTRFYKNQVLTFTPRNGARILSVKMDATTSSYANKLRDSDWNNAQASSSKTIVTIVPYDPDQPFSVKIGEATRASSVTVEYAGGLAPENSHQITVVPAENGTILPIASEAEPGAQIQLSAVPDEGYYLVKWVVMAGGTEVEVDEDGSFLMPDADVTVSAVFDKQEIPEGAFVEVTDLNDVTAGDYVIAWIANSESSYYYLPSGNASGSNPPASAFGTGVVVADIANKTVITSTVAKSMVWTFVGNNTNGFTVTDGTYYLRSTDKAQGITIESTDGSQTWTIEKNDTKGLLMKGSDGSGRCLALFKGSTTDWRYYAASGSSYSGTLHLFKKNSGGEEPVNPDPVATAVVTTAAATNIDFTSATISGSFTGATGEISATGFEYGDDAVSLKNVVSATAIGGSFSASLVDLEEGSTYYYRAFADEYNASTDAVERRYGAIRSFKTKSSGGEDPVDPPTPQTGQGWLSNYEVPYVADMLLNGDGNPVSGIFETCGDSWVRYNTTNENVQIAVHTFVHPDSKQTVRNYITCYDGVRYAPMWTAHAMHKEMWPMNKLGRYDKWQEDPAITLPQQNGIDNYNTLRLAKGHFVASASRQTTTAQNSQTFYYTNQAPQYQDSFNSGVWSSLEGDIQTNAPVGRDTLYIVTGILYEGETPSYPAKNGLMVPNPSHFYKCLMYCSFDEGGNMTSAKGVAYLYTNESHPKMSYYDEEFVTTIDAVEQRAGFNFFPNVPEEYQTAAESSSVHPVW